MIFLSIQTILKICLKKYIYDGDFIILYEYLIKNNIIDKNYYKKNSEDQIKSWIYCLQN